ncbi:MAG TPA: class I SAM-dependent methyltransferase [Pirellulales bacterium]|nr:class I SAM-dependent methyltransferase [Pirellulales bacterium]
MARSDYLRIVLVFLALGALLGLGGVIFRQVWLLYVVAVLAAIGAAALGFSIIGLFGKYGPPAAGYFRRLLRMGDVNGRVVVADLHVGTYRHTYMLAELLPEATIHTVDCFSAKEHCTERDIQEIRNLDSAPAGHPRIDALRADEFILPLADASCDVVVFGMGTHEIPRDGPREKLFSEARRILKPGGKALLFEHGRDLRNFLVLGPAIHHLAGRDEWLALMQAHFTCVQYARTWHPADLFVGTRTAWPDCRPEDAPADARPIREVSRE